jgi:protocatechuate 3,4-dioxygenase beta subunit
MYRRLLGASALTVLALAGTALLEATPQRKKVRDRQVSPPPTAFVLGRVVDATTSRPIARATVALVAEAALPAPVPRDAPRVLTDAAGRFVFRGIGPGRFRFTATAPGYLEGAAGQQRPGGISRPFAIDAGQGVGDLTIRLWREATIAGAVLDDTGAPVAGVWVSLLRREPGRAGAVAIRETGGDRTDDRGAYRISGILPGTYVVGVATRTLQAPPAGRPGTRIGAAVVQTGGDGMWAPSNVLAGLLPTTIRPDGRIVGYPSTYHPNAIAIASAAAIRVDAADDRNGVDIHLRPVTMSRVSGSVIGPSGPESGIEVALIPAFAAGQTIERTHGTISTASGASGAFDLAAVPPGQYRLRAWRRPQISVIGRDALPPDATLWSESMVEVGDDAIENLTLTLQPGATVSGQVRFEGAGAPPLPAQLQPPLSVAFEPPWFLAYGARLAARVTASFEFATEGLPPGRYFANLPNNFTNSLAARGWHFESAIHAGNDLTRTPLVLEGRPVTGVEIVFSDQRPAISGVVSDASGRPAADAAVVALPADYRAWIDNGLSPLAASTAIATQRGEYEMPLRPGAYLLAVVDGARLADWPDPAAINAIAATATRMTILRGEQRRLDLRRK